MADSCLRNRLTDGIFDNQISEEFRALARVNLTNFVNPSDAEQLYRELLIRTEWNTHLTSYGRKYVASAAAQKHYTSEQQQGLVDLAYQSACEGGTAFLFDVGRSVGTIKKAAAKISLFRDIVNGANFRERLRFCNRGDKVFDVDAQFVRLRSRHFVNLRMRPILESGSERCVAWYCYNLTPAWKADWGGTLEFRGHHGGDIAGYVPTFNCLTIVSCPQPHWFSTVSPAAFGCVYMIVGGIYA